MCQFMQQNQGSCRSRVWPEAANVGNKRIGSKDLRFVKGADAVAILNKLKTTKEYVSPAELAILYAGLGDKEGAFQSLERAYAAHDLQMQYLKVEPHYDSLRSDPRFTDLMRRVGLP